MLAMSPKGTLHLKPGSGRHDTRDKAQDQRNKSEIADVWHEDPSVTKEIP